MNKWANFLALSSVVFLATTSWSQTINPCNEVSISQQVSECAAYARQQAETELNAEYTATKKRIASIYQTHKDLGDKLTAALLKAQRAWLAFRDSNCEVEVFELEEDSEAHSAVLNNCIVRLDRDRTSELRKMAAE